MADTPPAPAAEPVVYALQEDGNGNLLRLLHSERTMLEGAREVAAETGGDPIARDLVTVLERLGRYRAALDGHMMPDTATPLAQQAREHIGALEQQVGAVADMGIPVEIGEGLRQKLGLATALAATALAEALQSPPTEATVPPGLQVDVDALPTLIWQAVANAPGGTTQAADAATEEVRKVLGLHEGLCNATRRSDPGPGQPVRSFVCTLPDGHHGPHEAAGSGITWGGEDQ